MDTRQQYIEKQQQLGHGADVVLLIIMAPPSCHELVARLLVPYLEVAVY
jgi:hypothetical protein